MRIHELDNVLVVKKNFLPGDEEQVGDVKITFDKALGFDRRLRQELLA